jgi:hypothetical protein
MSFTKELDRTGKFELFSKEMILLSKVKLGMFVGASATRSIYQLDLTCQRPRTELKSQIVK